MEGIGVKFFIIIELGDDGAIFDKFTKCRRCYFLGRGVKGTMHSPLK